MFTWHKSIDENQTVLSKFVSKKDKTDKKWITCKSPSTLKAHSSSVPSSSSTKKRNRPLSPPDSTIVQNKRAHMDNITESNRKNTTEMKNLKMKDIISILPDCALFEVTQTERKVSDSILLDKPQLWFQMGNHVVDYKCFPTIS